MVWQLDEPLADPAPLNVLYISRLAANKASKVLLSGAGGTIYLVVIVVIALENEKWWRWLPRSFRSQLRAITAHLPTRHILHTASSQSFSSAHLTGDVRLVHYFRWIERADLRLLTLPSSKPPLEMRGPKIPCSHFSMICPEILHPSSECCRLSSVFSY